MNKIVDGRLKKGRRVVEHPMGEKDKIPEKSLISFRKKKFFKKTLEKPKKSFPLPCYNRGSGNNVA